MTVLYYIMDGDDLLISTMLARGKAKAVQRNPKVSLCVLDENWPPTYITLFCDAVIEATVNDDPDAVADLLLRVLELMAGRELDPSAREHAREMAIKEERVVVRLKPYASFMTPPRHIAGEQDLETLTHWTSSSLPWNAEWPAPRLPGRSAEVRADRRDGRHRVGRRGPDHRAGTASTAAATA